MAALSDPTRGRAAQLDRPIIAWRPRDEATGPWDFEVGDSTSDSYRDELSMELVEELIDSLTLCRGGSIGDAGAQLSIIASLAAELDARLPEAIFEARMQQCTWADIARRLAMPESTIRHRYSDYVTCREELPNDTLD